MYFIHVRLYQLAFAETAQSSFHGDEKAEMPVRKKIKTTMKSLKTKEMKQPWKRNLQGKSQD